MSARRLAPLSLILFLALGVLGRAQAPQQETTPFTVWLDFHRLAAPGAAVPALPIWLAGINTTQQTDPSGAIVSTTIHLQLRALSDFDQKRLLRLFFEDLPGASPTVIGLDASGAQKFSRGPFGQGLNLPSSETIVFSIDGVAEVDILTPGDGHNIRGAFLATLRSQTMLRALDFVVSSDLIDAFGRMSQLQTSTRDLSLYGRVRATLDIGTAKLSLPDKPNATWEFDLQSTPLAALLNFEILNADAQAPMLITVNDQPLGTVTVQMPDLADPGYVGSVRPLVDGMHFRYAGWLHAQVAIPGTALKAGANSVVLQLNPESGSSAVRSLELQLKYNWNNLDYSVTPTAP
jgi:hypothetical protein